jgi:hypothetical protein
MNQSEQALAKRIRYAGFSVFIVMIALSIFGTFFGVLRTLDSGHVQDPITGQTVPSR